MPETRCERITFSLLFILKLHLYALNERNGDSRELGQLTFSPARYHFLSRPSESVSGAVSLTGLSKENWKWDDIQK